MLELNKEIEFLFETSWEVCNKVGGIYTVLSTKAKTLKETFKDKLIFIGPDVWSDQNPSPFFVETQSLMRKWLANAHLPNGVSVRIGRWNIPGRPVAVLVKFDGMYASKDAAYSRMWDLFQVDSLHAYGDYDEGCAFARAAAEVIKSIVTYYNVNPKKVVAHFDEWTTAMGMLALKADMPDVATVFTTHATSIGRSICGNGKQLYEYLNNYNGDQMARELNMESKHSLEKAAAHNADCFTTVSEVTAIESEQLLDRRPDVVTPNGFELNFVPGKTKYKSARKNARATLLNVAGKLTGVNYSEDTFIVATAGRCEYRNKGLDVFLDSLSALSQKDHSRKVLAFVLVPAWCAGARADLQEALSSDSATRLDDPLLTHVLNNYNEDPINRRIHETGFTNDTHSNVSVIYVPSYLNGSDGIFNKSYYELLPGLDATVFASYYEPWGYTPQESVAFGVPAITTTLAGFGQWILDNFDNTFIACGVKVEKRTDNNYNQLVENIVADLESLINSSEKDSDIIRRSAMETAKKTVWTDFIVKYDEAYNIALSKK